MGYRAVRDAFAAARRESRLLIELGRRRIAARLADARPRHVFRHAVVGDLDVAYRQEIDEDGTVRHWFLGAGRDGIVLARPWTAGPLVEGRPEADRAEMEAELARLAAGPRPGATAVTTAFFEHKEWDETRSVEIHDAIRAVAMRLSAHLKVMEIFRHQMRSGPTIVGMTQEHTDAGFARALTLRSDEAKALARLNKLDFPLLHAALIHPDLALDRPVREIERQVMYRLGIPEAAMRRLPEELKPGPSHVLAMSSLPIDWMPQAVDHEAWKAMGRIAWIAKGMGATGEDIRTLLDSSKGDWIDFEARCIRELHGTKVKVDPWTFARNAPILANDVVMELEVFLEDLAVESGLEGWRSDLVARLALREGRSLPAVFEATRLWHVRFNPPARDGVTWEALLPTWTHPRTGVEVTPLTGGGQLVEEGRAMDHCVGGESFARSSLRDESRIVSLRRRGKRLSTAEIRLGGEAGPMAVVQHFGRRNREPDGTAAEALDAYLALPEVARAMLAGDPKPVEMPPRTKEENEELLDAWRPFLAGRWRNAPLRRFREELVPETPEMPSP